MTNFAAQQWATDIILPLLKEVKAKKVFVPTGFSNYYNPLYSEYFENMKFWIKGYDVNIFLSDDYRDINFARENGINNIVVVPNGADEREFEISSDNNIRQCLGIKDKEFLIFLVGSHNGEKGHSEAIEIFKKAKIKNATLLIIGNSFHKSLVTIIKDFINTFNIKNTIYSIIFSWLLNCRNKCIIKKTLFNFSIKRFFDKKKIIIKSLSRKDTIDVFMTGDLFLFPSNIECSPIVLFECMASKTPFLVTDVGNSSEIIEWSGGGELLPTKKTLDNFSYAKISESAHLLEELFNDAKRRETLSLNGYKAWKEDFTWDKISHKYEELYMNLLKSKDN